MPIRSIFYVVLCFVAIYCTTIVACSKRKDTMSEIIGLQPSFEKKYDKGVDFTECKLYIQQKNKKFEDYVAILEASYLWKDYSQVNFNYTIDIKNDPSASMYEFTELKRISYINYNSKIRYILISYDGFFVICKLRV